MRSLMRVAALAAALSTCVLTQPARAQVVAPVPTFLFDRAASGSITTAGSGQCSTSAASNTGCTILNAPGAATVQATVTGTFSQTLTPGCLAADGATWNPVQAFPQAGGSPVSTITAPGSWFISYAGCQSVRLFATAFVSGTAVVGFQASAVPTVLVGGRLVADNSPRLSYDLTNTITVPTSAQSLAAIEADANNKLRLRYIKICLTSGLQTTAGERQIGLFRSTAASSGGSAVTPSVLDAGDAAFGGVARTGSITTTPAVGSVTQALLLWSGTIFMPAAATTAVPCIEKHFDLGGVKAPSAAAGVANGLAIADLTGGAGGTGNYVVDMHFSAEPN
jgi:hypothetical protein